MNNKTVNTTSDTIKDEGVFIPKSMLLPIANYSTQRLADFVISLQGPMVELFKEKDKNYNGSWMNRGIISAQLNFERKIDRINAQFYNGTISHLSNENIGDTLMDTSIYSLFYLFYLYETVPSVKMQVDEFIEKYTLLAENPTNNGNNIVTV